LDLAGVQPTQPLLHICRPGSPDSRLYSPYSLLSTSLLAIFGPLETRWHAG